MAIRIRIAEGTMVALCAARSMPVDGDVYLDDAQHHALGQKFLRDFIEEGLLDPLRLVEPEAAAIVEREESNNTNREWWDKTYGTGAVANPSEGLSALSALAGPDLEGVTGADILALRD